MGYRAPEGVDAAWPTGNTRQTVPPTRHAQKGNTVNLRKIAGTATLAGAIGAAALGLGAGAAQAAPKWNSNPTVPHDTDFTQPPGHVGRNLGTPPGQFKKLPDVTVGLSDGSTVVIDNPFEGVPPGHWAELQGDFEAAVAAASP